MKAKLGNETVDVWQVSLNEPTAADQWILEEFKKEQLCWSGILTRKEVATRDWSTYQEKTWENWQWILPYTSVKPLAAAYAYPYELLVIVNQFRFPAFAAIDEWIVKIPGIGLQVYSEKKAKKYLKLGLVGNRVDKRNF